MDKSRKRALRRVAAKQAPGTAAPGARVAQDAMAQSGQEEPLSLAQSRRKRAMRIAKRAAMEAARANSVGLASLEAEQNGQLGESQATAESILSRRRRDQSRARSEVRGALRRPQGEGECDRDRTPSQGGLDRPQVVASCGKEDREGGEGPAQDGQILVAEDPRHGS